MCITSYHIYHFHFRIEIPMMFGKFTLPVGRSRELGCRVLEIPFKERRMSFFILLPEALAPPAAAVNPAAAVASIRGKWKSPAAATSAAAATAANARWKAPTAADRSSESRLMLSPIEALEANLTAYNMKVLFSNLSVRLTCL